MQASHRAVPRPAGRFRIPGGTDPGRSIDARIGAAMLPSDWRIRTWLALDFETTGLSPRDDRVVEIGALRFLPEGEGARETGSLSSLVDPGIPIPPVVTGIHGIGDADVAGFPPFRDFVTALLGLAEGAIIVAHNAPFDLGFLREELSRAGIPAFYAPSVDTRLLAKAAFPGRPGYGLGNLARELGIDRGQAHRALDDARACMRLFLLAAARIAPGAGA